MPVANGLSVVNLSTFYQPTLDYSQTTISNGDNWVIAELSGTVTLLDDTDGNLYTSQNANAGTVDYTTGAISFNPQSKAQAIRNTTTSKEMGTEGESITDNGGTNSSESTRLVTTGYDFTTVDVDCVPGDPIMVKYKAALMPSTTTETVTLSAIDLDVTPGFARRITRNSLRFKIGTSVFVDNAGAIYRDPSPATGAGTIVGSLDPTTGTVALTQWVGGMANTITLESLLTQIGSQPVDAVTFRIPISPVKPGTLQLRWSALTGTAYNKTVNDTGILIDNDCIIKCDYTRGVVKANFGRWYLVEDLTDAQKLEPWYNPDAIVIIEEVEKIWRPKLVSAETIVYNAVASSYLPPDSNLLGLDAAKLPPDGKTLIYKPGDLVLVHHTIDTPYSSLTPNQVINTNQTRLYRAIIVGDNGVALDPSLYSVDRATGLITLSAALSLNGLTSPYHVKHTIADLARVISTDITGRITLMTPLSHTFIEGSYCSGVMYAGTLQARVSNLFSQSTWTSAWSDSLIGSAPLAQYNDALYPIVVKNDGAYPDRFLVKFISATDYQVIGENLGLIAVGDINTDCEPINSLTSRAYFKIKKEGWGLGWATGNCLRFNVHGATYPVDLIRAVQPSPPTELTDCVELLFIGNTDA
ncbi:hypothetical protein HUU62_08620 [Rhodoferax sp. 4810]|uniref:Uncharacterized protein n=1 Tax=Thiospirillum jenense TaxID=1653858 RepID=A0A839HDT6_9GAMM|nr:hypothetical protein [Thiospirillum jenense]MBB1074472.1 hypothetical protein [Rhodoferax jenense]MBB1125546.1 hypothetical protein [Thiospirillum jenense]